MAYWCPGKRYRSNPKRAVAPVDLGLEIARVNVGLAVELHPKVATLLSWKPTPA